MASRLLLLCVVVCSLASLCLLCAPVGAEIPAMPNMLELSTRPWLYSLSQKYGHTISRLRDIPLSEFQDIADRGIDIIWMMGIWQLGPYGLHHDQTDPGLLSSYSKVLPGYTNDDIIGSPYAIVDYSCNSELGSDSDIAWVRKTLNSMGMYLMLDFVPNHSACDCSWTNTSIDYYIRAPKDLKPPYDPNVYLPNGIAFGGGGYGSHWTDVAQLNYWNPNLRSAMIENLHHIASLADAIRCDMAFLVLNDVFEQSWNGQLQSWGWTKPSDEFWPVAFKSVKDKYPATIFLAETYADHVAQLQSPGWFDFTYEKALLDKLKGYDLNDIRGYIQSLGIEYLHHSSFFTENHDEDTAIHVFGDNVVTADAAASLEMTLPGMKFYFQGQWQGLRNKLDVHLRRSAPETPDPTAIQFYHNLTSILDNDVFQGTWTYVDVGASEASWRLMAWRWDNGDEKRVCVVNFSDTTGSGAVKLSNAQPRHGNDTIPFTELFSGSVYYRSAADVRSNGLFCVVDGWSAQIFDY